MTEVEQTDLTAKIKLEGDLTESTLPIFAEALAGYAQRGIQSVRIDAAGLLRIDQPALEQSHANLPADLHLVFYTALPTHQHQLHSSGFDAVYQP